MSTDDTQPVSGSRWEPEGDGRTDPTVPTQPPAPTVATPPAYAPAYSGPVPTNARPHRGRLALAGGAVGIALVAGAGGFALGHAAAEGGGEDQFGRTGFGPNGFPNHGQPPPGLQNGPGAVPPGQGDDSADRDGDGDGPSSDEGQDDEQDDGQDDGATQGSFSTT